ncbi:MAG: 5-methyltetrahydropteroyltriglutamate--homocysteine S-methyltransferase [Reyranella sp.]|nr:5-methyltetrahydropteroyltriglutamate--homocysteine S-methyltransferase [Reyranella sp.]
MSTPPFRAEVIGSLLRPRALKDTATAIAAGKAAAADYKAVLEREIARVVAKQEELGLKVVTDGEFGRTSWFGFFFEGLDGFRLEPSLFRFRDSEGGGFEWPTCVAAAKIHRRAPITLAEYRRLKAFARQALPKATLPTPSAFHFFRFTQPFDPAVYDQQHYFDDLVAVYRTELAELAEAGCRYVQMDEVPVAMLCDPLVREQAKAQGGDPDRLLDLYVDVMRRILEGRPAGVTVGMHLCRGNFRSRWMASGGYEPVAARLFNDFPVDAYFLEYDSQRAGDFSPLRHVPKDRHVVLGLVSSKTPVLESRDDLRRRIDEAAKYVYLDRLSLSSQCGFASVAGGNSIDEETQWAKLGLIVDTARAVWGTA